MTGREVGGAGEANEGLHSGSPVIQTAGPRGGLSRGTGGRRGPLARSVAMMFSSESQNVKNFTRTLANIEEHPGTTRNNRGWAPGAPAPAGGRAGGVFPPRGRPQPRSAD
jgi:hypothetical protein